MKKEILNDQQTLRRIGNQANSHVSTNLFDDDASGKQSGKNDVKTTDQKKVKKKRTRKKKPKKTVPAHHVSSTSSSSSSDDESEKFLQVCDAMSYYVYS